MKLRFLLLSMITFLLLGPLSASGMECKVPPFITRAVTPNVLIILDNSGSTMTEDIPGYLNRWQAAKAVIMNLLQDPVSEGFHWGLMRMDGAASTGERSEWDWQDPVTGKWFNVDDNFVRHGGKLLRPVGTDRAEIVAYINGMEVYDTVPHTYTVNGETLFTAAQYFAGGNGPAGLGTYKGDADTNYQYRQGATYYWARDRDDYGNAIDTSSPITDWCQKNFVIYLTDGESNCDSDWDRLINLVGDYDGDGADDPNVDEWDESGGNHYVDDVAKWMYENDLRTDEDTMPGLQNVITYIVGLKINSPLLQRAGDENHGRGGFYYAGDYDQLKDAFGTIVNDIILRISSGTAVAVQSTSTQGARRLIRAKFVPEAWTGNLEAFDLPYNQGEVPLWDAGIVLKNTNPDQRYIFTAVDILNGVIDDLTVKLDFTEANSSTQDADNVKLSDMLGAVDDAEAKKIIRYIRGESVVGYRERPDGWKLGDIAYSSPIISGDTVYVGANDGMLHAFDINTGEEKWAFIPNNLLTKLKDLTLPEYCHEYFVDLSPKVAEIYVGGVFKKVLVGGERGGGYSFFALDITDSTAAGVQPMWEFSDKYLGESWTIPAIAKCWLDGAERWVAFIGSAQGNKDTKGYLFAVDVATGEKLGTELLLTGAPENQLPSLRVIDFDSDGYADRVFVGCITEKLFLVEVGPGANPKTWKNSHILSTDPGQPISVPTSLSLYKEGGQTNVMAYFGTGKYYTLDDKTDLTLQTFYAVKDNAVKVGKGGLANQTDANTCTPILGGFGWYIDLVQGPGERVVSSSLVIGGYVFFTTFQPSDDPCEAGGIARLYIVGYENGCIPSEPVIDVDGDGDVDSDDMDGMTDGRSIDIGYGIPSDIIFDPADSTIIIQTSDTTIHVFKVDVLSKRLTVHSWREVID
jgi:type IV pilus assembly protein PilY1